MVHLLTPEGEDLEGREREWVWSNFQTTYIICISKNTHTWSQIIQTVQKPYSENKSVPHLSPRPSQDTVPPLSYLFPERECCARISTETDMLLALYQWLSAVFIVFHNAFFFFST